MAFQRACVLALVCLFAPAGAEAVTLRVNPIRRVVNLLQGMTKKIDAEGKAEEELFEKFMCYCKNGRGSLEASIAAAEDKIPKVKSAIEELDAKVGQLTADIKAAKEGREEAKAAIAVGTALREKEAAAFAKESSDFSTNIAAMGKAVTALEKGAGGSFLQTQTASVLRKISISMDMSSVDRDMLSSFLSTGSGEDYAPQSGQIVGILKQMQSTMEADLKDITEKENASKEAFESMAASKAKEIEAMTAEIEAKTARVGEGGVELVNMKEDLEDTEKALEEDKAFLADLAKNCKTKQAEWDERQKIRAEEILAVHETIKILNDDDALDLFKKTLPSPSLVQLKRNRKSLQNSALATLSGTKDVRLNLIMLAMKGKKVSFEKVLGMIDAMVKLLGEEQNSDDEKKAYCDAEVDKTEDELKALERKHSDLEKAIEEHKSGIATLTEEIKALEDGIKNLDKEVADATENRKEEHAEFTSSLAANSAAVELLGLAKNRMNKFYNPKLYKAPPAVVPALAQVAPPPPPETAGAYAKKGGESGGVIAMMDMMVADLDKEITEVEVEEKNAQAEYEQLIGDSAAKRASDSKSIEDKEATKADLEARLLKDEEEKTATTKEAMATHQYLGEVHSDCDWLLTNFDTRKTARAGEVDALTKAKAVLSGADYSLLQKAEVHRHA